MPTNSRLPFPASVDGPTEEYVGSAHMRLDGTIELKLWTKGSGDIIGEAMFIVKTDDPRYFDVVNHLSGITPGGYAPVRPFPPSIF